MHILSNSLSGSSSTETEKLKNHHCNITLFTLYYGITDTVIFLAC